MKCTICSKSPMNSNVVLIRQNLKGESGIFHCSNHSKQLLKKNTKKLVETISGTKV